MGLKQRLHRTAAGQRLGSSGGLQAGRRVALLAARPFVVGLQWAWYQTPRVEGPGHLKLGERCSPVNTIFNLASGDITIGDDTIFGYHCMVLTGRHRFHEGERASLSGRVEVERRGGDITIGRGCWIASGAVIVGPVTIGDHVIVAGGAIVNQDVPDHAVVGGVPARVIGDTRSHRVS